MTKMTIEQMITNDALTKFLDVNADKKWNNHLGTWDSIVWFEDATDKPSESDYLSQKETLEQNQRAILTRSYPSWQDQMDMQYHDEVNGTTTWKDTIKAIKDANPKTYYLKAR
jgi:hypothetical protein